MNKSLCVPRRLISGILAGCFAVVAIGASAQTTLPKDVQADLLKVQIFKALQSKDLAVALAKIDEFKNLGVALPPPLALVEAKAASHMNQHVRALAALTSALSGLERGSAQYTEAIALYSQYESAVAAERSQRARDSERATSDKLLAKAQQLFAAGKPALAQYPLILYREKPNQSDPAVADELHRQITSSIEERSRQLARDLADATAMVTVPRGTAILSKGKEAAPQAVEPFRLAARALDKNFLRVFCQDVFNHTSDHKGKVNWREAWTSWHNSNASSDPFMDCYGDNEPEVVAKLIQWLNEHGNTRYRLPTWAEWARTFAAGVPPGWDNTCVALWCFGSPSDVVKEIERRRSREFGSAITWPDQHEGVYVDMGNGKSSAWSVGYWPLNTSSGTRGKIYLAE